MRSARSPVVQSTRIPSPPPPWQRFIDPGAYDITLPFASVWMGWQVAVVDGVVATISGITGKMQIFLRTPSGFWLKHQQLTITGSGGTGGDVILAMHKDTIVFNSKTVASVVLKRNTSDVWVSENMQSASGTATGGEFAVSIKDDTIITGWASDDVGRGAVIIWDKVGTLWSIAQKLTISGGLGNDVFGINLSLDTDLLVAATREDEAGLNEAGSVYTFTRSGGVWSQQQRLVASDAAVNDRFGQAVAILGSTLLIGNNKGKIYFFTENAGVWTEQQIITGAIGTEIDLDGENTFISNATVFTRSGNVWTQSEVLTSEAGADGTPVSFGWDCGMYQGVRVVSDYRETYTGISSGIEAGAVYVYNV